ncbi:MAG TPA: TonB-dependent receptor [Steroidobacteraceae bacterium]|jgi:iron complex outermembrane receptor protein|nr:TonB-dependent receptor [Steroidobacteraceae bacterium]
MGSRSRYSLVTGVAAAVLLTAGPVFADTAPAASESTLDEVIVTAQKRSERLSDVPLSITAETGDQLTKEGISSPTDLARVVPGFSYQKSSYGVPVFTIRGIGVYDTFVGMSPAVTVYVDQVPLPYLAMTPGATLDLERVEAIKGPQGTLFGQNSTGGAINYIAAKPTKELHAGGDLTYGRFNEIDAEAFVSGPLSETFTARLSVRKESRDAWQTSESHPGDTLGKRDFGEARLLMDWVPIDTVRVEINLNGWQDKSDTQAMQFEQYAAARPLNGVPPGYPESFIAFGNRAPAPQNSRVADWDAPPYRPLTHDDKFYQSALRADVDLPANMTLTSITAYSHYTAFDTTDADGTDFDNFLATIDAAIHSFSQELRLAGTWSRATYTLGANYQNDVVNDDDIGHYTGSNSGVGPFRYTEFRNRADQKISTKGVFGALDFKLTDTLTAQASARYTRQNRDFTGCLVDGGDGALASALAFFRQAVLGIASQPAANGSCVSMDANFNTVPVVAKSLDENNVSWRTGLNWKPSDGTLIYANVTKGFKAGSFTPLPALFAAQLTPVTQESVLAYEAGIKIEPVRSLQLTAAIYYDDYKNKQILGFQDFPIFGPLPALQNIPKMSIKGAEFELLARPIEGLRLSAGAAYVDSRVDRSFISEDPYGRIIDLKGEASPNTPKWQFVGDTEYGHPVGHGWAAFLGGDISDRSSSFAAFGESPTFEIHGYSLLDLRTGIESEDGKWRVQLWGHNVLNKYYLSNVSRLVDSIAATTAMPATYGVSVHARF